MSLYIVAICRVESIRPGLVVVVVKMMLLAFNVTVEPLITKIQITSGHRPWNQPLSPLCVVYLLPLRYGQPLTSGQWTNSLPQNNRLPYKITSESGQPHPKGFIKHNLDPSFHPSQCLIITTRMSFLSFSSHYSSLSIFARDFHVQLAVSHTLKFAVAPIYSKL